ncbi:hypothetical protein Zmor_028366 [Zophobas morio]|uniref:Uncharacterized protein n=1 Tax=Zophobas morio TaxID=2755281 RepID=A0AA38HQY4_9CUCU|nr:hypothetical protein Zmor_028366 [Zophobas morio]
MTFTTAHEFHEIYYNVFPDLWDLHVMGEKTFKMLEKTATRLTLGYKISILLCILAATIGLPWYGDEYEIILPVRVFTDIFGKWRFPFIFIFYLSFYHAALTTLGCITGILYLMLHLYNQCFLLNRRLENLNHDVDTRGKGQYQDRVNYEITCCIRHHQTLLK